MYTKVHIPLTPEGDKIMKLSQHAFCAALKGKFDCTAVIHSVDVPTASSFASVTASTMGAIRYSKQLANNVKISVWRDDLTVHKVDAVVNAANEQLSHGGGLAGALRKAGGPQIQDMSNQIIRHQGKVPTGKAVVTPAGNLPCKKIIHAVGPQVSLYPSTKELEYATVLLESAVWSALQITDYENLQSVAIPAVSSGLYNFPRTHCADVIVNTVKTFSEKRHSLGRSLDVRLVNNDEPSVQEMQRACKEFLGLPDHRGYGHEPVAGHSRASASPEQPGLKLGNLILFIKKGAIELETADVIVNTVGGDLDLSVGQISNAILKIAGDRMQKDIKNGRPAPLGSVIPTGGYNLKCEAVFHTVCAQRNSNDPADKILYKVVLECLTKASQRGFSSICFPAIGTGKLGFRNEEASEIMIRAVQNFASTYRGKKMDVRFVIYSKDNKAFKVFEQQMTLLRSAIGSSATGKSSPPEDNEGHYIELHARSAEALREAQAWAVGLLHRLALSAQVKNNLIMHFGQKDHENLMSLQAMFNVHITVSFSKGRCDISITGTESTAVSSAVIQVEALLCEAQEDFTQTEEADLLHSVVRWEGSHGSEEPRTSAALEKAYLAGDDTVLVNGRTFMVDLSLGQAKTGRQDGLLKRMCVFSLYSKMPTLTSRSYYGRINRVQSSNSSEDDGWRRFSKCGLNIVKVEELENYALKQLFELNKKRVPGEPKWLYQRVTAQFCQQICRVGFHRDYAPPEEQRSGAGIYFTTSVDRALKLWEDIKEEYIYIVEAQVLTGKSTSGSPELIVPPPIGADPLVCYDSVKSAVGDVYVIFHAQQALPLFLYTCTKV